METRSTEIDFPERSYFLKPFPRKGMETENLPDKLERVAQLSQTFSPQGDGNS